MKYRYNKAKAFLAPAVVLCSALAFCGHAQAQQWQSYSFGEVPAWASIAGWEADGRALFVCRAPYAGGLHIGKIRQGFSGCNVVYGGQEVAVLTYEVFTQPLAWAAGAFGSFSSSLQAGYEADGRPLYICRGNYANGLHIGKIRQGFSGCNIGYGGQEFTLTTYEVGF